mgnify:CR=1 FL=1
MSLYENINKRKRLGISRSKADSTISKSSYSNMQKGFPKKANVGALIGGQKKLDKNKDGKISGEDFKMMKPKKAFLGKLIKRLFKGKKKVDSNSAMLNMSSKKQSPLISMYQKATDQKKAKHGKMIKARYGVMSKGNLGEKLVKKSIGGYMKKANRGMMMEKPSTRGFGAARTSGMGLENESLQPGKIYDKVKARKGKMAKASMGEFVTVSEYSEDLI